MMSGDVRTKPPYRYSRITALAKHEKAGTSITSKRQAQFKVVKLRTVQSPMSM